jgi:hypothetical protein
MSTDDRTVHAVLIPARPWMLLATLLLLGSPVSAEDPTVIGGFLKGGMFLEQAAARREAYAMGLVDGFLLAPLWGAPKATRFEACVQGMASKQVSAMLEKEIRDHPQEWHLPAHFSMFRAFEKACGREGAR